MASASDFALTPLLAPGVAAVDPFAGLQPIQLPLHQAGAALAIPRSALGVPGTQLIQAAEMTPTLAGAAQLTHLQASTSQAVPSSIGVLTALPSNVPKTEAVADTSFKSAVTSNSSTSTGLVDCINFFSLFCNYLWVLSFCLPTAALVYTTFFNFCCIWFKTAFSKIHQS